MILLFYLRTAAKFSVIFLSHPMHIQLQDWGQLICWWQWCVLLFSSLPLFQLIYFVKCRQTLLQLNSLEPCSRSKRKRKFCHGLLTSPMKCEIWHFQVIVMKWQQRNVQKVCCMCKVHMLSCLLDPILCFWLTFSLPPSLMILFALFSINVGRCLYVWTPILVLILVFVYFLCGIRKYSCVIKNNRKMQTI